MFNQLTNEKFEEIMNQITGGLWLKVICETIKIDVFYPEFEFLIFSDRDRNSENYKYQFGHKEFDDENNFQNISIDIDDISSIHRCLVSPLFNAEQIVLRLRDDVEIILETENC